jgi:RNA polymerase-binding transcription factor DksA
MDDRQRKQIETRLLEERKSRLEALAELDERFKERMEGDDGDLTNYPLHMADEGTDTMEQEKQSLMVHQEGEQLMAIDDALRTLYKEPERFGRCERCGSDISMERLELVPWATHCASCQEALESGAGAGEAG